MRLFIALPLDGEIKKELGREIAIFKQKGGNVKWVEPKNIHLTLKFLGETDPKVIESIKRHIDDVAAAGHAVDTAISRLGAFPNFNRPRVIWVGIEKDKDVLEQIANKLEHRMESLGWERENRGFQAHLTLGRIREPRGLESLVTFLKEYRFIEIPVSFHKIVLFKSTLTPQGPIYESLHEAKLGGAAAS